MSDDGGSPEDGKYTQWPATDRSIVAVVLAGGTGTRLYPASRPDRPKQLLSFGGEQSLLRETVDRAAFADEMYVLTRPTLADRVREHVPEVGVLTEPEPRDTGPALTYATHRIREQVGECVLAILPSDHYVAGPFAETMVRAARVAVATDRLVTVGVEPTRPETGYGYIAPGEPLVPGDDGNERDCSEPGTDCDDPATGRVAAVDRFTEKPDRETATEYVDANCLWNAGLFAWTPEAFLREAREGDTEKVDDGEPPLAGLVEALERDDPVDGFESVESISVDYAVFERTDAAAVVRAAFEWDDLGSWDAVGRILDADDAGNAALGEAVTIDAADNVIATDGHVSLVGVEDLVVASFDGRTLVVPRADSERVRDLVAGLPDDWHRNR